MKKYLLIFLLLNLKSILFSQTFIGNYNFIDNQLTNPILASKREYKLIINNSNSIFTLENDKLLGNYETSQEEVKGGEVVLEKLSDDYARFISKQKTIFYKDYLTNKILYNTLILNKDINVEDKTNNFDWKLKLTPVEYQGLHCSVATVNHRGRNWTVYYTIEIPFTGGPWKFAGLPGMIVYAKSDDGNFIFELTSFKVEKENVKVENPFKNNKVIIWDEYTKLYYTSFKNLIKRMKSEDEDGGETKITLNDMIEDLGFKTIQ